MAALPSEDHLNVGSCALVIVEVKWATDLFDMPLSGYYEQLAIDLDTKRLRAELLRQIFKASVRMSDCQCLSTLSGKANISMIFHRSRKSMIAVMSFGYPPRIHWGFDQLLDRGLVDQRGWRGLV